MIAIETNKSLTDLNTLAIPSRCDEFAELTTLEDVDRLLAYIHQHQLAVKVLGGGSNLVLDDHVAGLVVKVAMLGIEEVSHDSGHVTVKAMAGEDWHGFVRLMVSRGYSGLENLALIPGTVGASPVQNIGAYGVEVADCLESLDALDLHSGTVCHFSNADCRFSYRSSIFKEQEGRYLITSVNFRLSKTFKPCLSYGPLADLKNQPGLTAQDVFNSIVNLRETKLPDPANVPNAGSFFKNPIVSESKVKSLLKRFPDMIWYPSGEKAKLAAGWLIEQVGLKGACNDQLVGCYSEQALVLINPKGATSRDVQAWAAHVTKKVFETFGVALEQEPRFWK